MLQKCIFIFNIFYLKNYICLNSMKKDFCIVKIFSFEGNIVIFNQNLFVFKKFLFPSGFFHANNYLYIHVQQIFLMIFVSQIGPSICQWNIGNRLHCLYPDLDACVSHKTEPQILRFVFGLRRVKCNFPGGSFVHCT